MTPQFGGRLRAALMVAGLHLLLSAALALAVAMLVFQLWFPSPYDELIHGRQLFFLITAVDVVCGPLLTLVLFSPHKSKSKWRIDVGLIVLIQCTAFGYGLWQLSTSRPVRLAFEGERFRVVQAADVKAEELTSAPDGLRVLGWTGPKLAGVRLLEPTDPEFPKSVQMAIQGLHPAFRPMRWESYKQSKPRVAGVLRPLTELALRYPAREDELTAIERTSGLRFEDLGFLPMVSGMTTDWVVVLRRQDMQPVGYLHMDAW